MSVNPSVLLCLLGAAVAATAHVGSKAAERRARESYQDLVGADPDLPEDSWQEVRPLAGRWGCLVAGLELLRGVGLALALGTGLYLIVR